MHDDDDAIGAEDLIAKFEEGLDVLVVLRQLLVEARIHPELDGKKGHHNGEYRERAKNGGAVSEEQAFESVDQLGDHDRA